MKQTAKARREREVERLVTVIRSVDLDTPSGRSSYIAIARYILRRERAAMRRAAKRARAEMLSWCPTLQVVSRQAPLRDAIERAILNERGRHE